MLEFNDQMGNNIRLENYPKRIISLVPSQTELLYDLGLNNEVIGITKFCIHPNEWFRNKTRVGGTKKINFEKIKELKPDLIIGNKEENEQSQIEELMELYPVWMSDIKKLDEAYAMIASIGEVTGKQSNASDLVKKIKAGFDGFVFPPTNLKTLYLIWKDPYMTVNDDTFIFDILLRCGLSPVSFSSMKLEKEATRYPQLSAAEIKEINPAVILLSSEPYPFKEKHIEELRLLCPDAIIKLVDGEIFSWYGSRLLKAPAYFKQLIAEIAG